MIEQENPSSTLHILVISTSMSVQVSQTSSTHTGVTGEVWTAPVPSERSQTPCSHAPVSPRARCWRPWRWHTHLLPQFTGPDSGAIEEIEIVTLWCYQGMSKKVMLRKFPDSPGSALQTLSISHCWTGKACPGLRYQVRVSGGWLFFLEEFIHEVTVPRWHCEPGPDSSLRPSLMNGPSIRPYVNNA